MISKYSVGNILYRNTYNYIKKAKIWAVVEQSTFFLRAVVWIYSIQLTQHLFENVINTKNSQLIITYLLLVGFSMIVNELLIGASKYLLSKNSYSNMGKFMVDFQRKLGRIAAIHFEESDFLDKVHRAKECIEHETLGYFSSACLQLLSYDFILILFVMIYLYTLYPPLVFIIIVSFIPHIISQWIYLKYFEHLEDDLLPLRRQSSNYKNAIIGRKSFKETRLLGGFQFFYQLYKNTLNEKISQYWQTEKKIFIIRIILSSISFISTAFAIIVLVLAVIHQNISIANFSTIFLLLFQIVSLMEELVTHKLGKFGESFNQVVNVYKIMDMEEINHRTNKVNQTGIYANNIVFHYPDNSNCVINGIDVTINAGQTYAIVGENGSGKSTLVKLLLGLYIPKTGHISLYQPKSSKTLYDGSSAVFQQFQRYKMTLQNNVSISDIKQPNQSNKVIDVLEKSQFTSKKVKLASMLSPEFGGIDVSGGQWQRIAIARAIYKSYQFIVLDEPTASIDPIQESYIFEQFKELTKGATALIVTHRLASAKYADEIIVLEKGKIVEQGNHETLMNLKNVYYHMWKSQEYWYQQ